MLLLPSSVLEVIGHIELMCHVVLLERVRLAHSLLILQGEVLLLQL